MYIVAYAKKINYHGNKLNCVPKFNAENVHYRFSSLEVNSFGTQLL